MINDPAKTTWMYVDASNLYGALSDILAPGQYIDFKEIIACIEKDFTIHKIKAYGSFIADEPHSSLNRRKFIGAQNKFFNTIINTPKVEFQKGYFSKSSGKEKGIDVRIAVDMVKDSYEGSYKCGIIMTGDDHFLYGVECVRKINIPVHLTAMGSRYPYGLARNVDAVHVYDLFDYFKNNIAPAIRKPLRKLVLKGVTNDINILSV